jgi:hypothetical protein
MTRYICFFIMNKRIYTEFYLLCFLASDHLFGGYACIRGFGGGYLEYGSCVVGRGYCVIYTGNC